MKKNRLFKNIKKRIKNIYLVLEWFFKFFLKSPRFELYVNKLDKVNRDYFMKVTEQHKKGKDGHIEEYYSVNLPKKLWIYWAQGEINAPLIVKKCMESWRTKNPNWEIIILDEENIEHYINTPVLPSCLPVRYHANLIRTMLLEKYGGAWVDATTYCHRSLDSWLPLLAYNGFFMFTNPSDERDIENWFIVSVPRHPLIASWRNKLEQYYTTMDKVHPAYFLAFYIYQWNLINNAALAALARKSSGLNAGPCFIMKSVLLGNTKLIELEKHIIRGLPMSKLDWRLNVSENEFIKCIKLLDDL